MSEEATRLKMSNFTVERDHSGQHWRLWLGEIGETFIMDLTKQQARDVMFGYYDPEALAQGRFEPRENRGQGR